MKNSKRWGITLVALVLVTVTLFAFATYKIDPLLQYGKESDIFSYWQYTEMYTNPGIAKNYDYDAVLVGSSMIEHTDVNKCNENWNCNLLKVPYSGGSSYNHKTILDVCFKSNDNIKTVYWALDEYALTTERDVPRYPLPEYLYDFDKTNDISYLMNLDVFYFYTFKNIMGTLSGTEKKAMDMGTSEVDKSVYNKANMMKTLDLDAEVQPSKGKHHYEDNLMDNIRYNIEPLVKENPDTEFVFYMVPYSIAYWQSYLNDGTLESNIYNAKTAIKEILKYDNAKVFFFQDEKDIILELEHYKDFTHFSPEINNYMTEQIAQGNYEITSDNYEKVLGDFYDFLIDFDYNTFYENQMK